MNEQVINSDGRWVRLVPRNKFSESESDQCPVVRVESVNGFYRLAADGVEARDVTQLWRAKHP